jgi:predicted metal-dependent phosphoesterase TrpH
MKFDLHFHTTLSDGMKTSEEAVKIAQERGLQFMACTDHDLINTQVPEFAKSAGIETVQ